MKLDQSKLTAAAETAKSKTTDRRWIAAIDRAVSGLSGGKWIVTELSYTIAVTTESEKTYFAGQTCQCVAYNQGMPCKHRAAARLIDLYNAAPTSEPKPEPTARVTRSIEQDRTGAKHVVVRCD